MTYCTAMRLDEGLVFLSDTRTNAGVDNVSTYRKLFVFQPRPGSTLVIQSAGNLGTTQEVLDRIRRDLDDPEAAESLRSANHLFEAALYVGRLSVEVAASHRAALGASGADGTSTFILGGQIGTGTPDIYLVYPEGNYISASEDRPFLQIGETKYGKFMMELATEAGLDLEGATKVALSSMVSTARANLSVGPPYDLGVYTNDEHEVLQFRIEADSPFLSRLEEVWARNLAHALSELPSLEPGDLVIVAPE
jgi:putative proteasome-type protease